MGSRRPFRAVLYDWDGTLADTAEVSFRCYVAVFASFGRSFERADFERTYCPDWYRTYVAMGLPERDWPEADRRWLEQFAREPCRALPGAQEALGAAASAGLAQGLVTSGDRERVQRDMRALGLARFFGAAVFGGDTQRRKPHPEPLQLALERLGLAPAQTAYVGDSPEDIEMARAAGAFAVGIPGGFPNREALERARPDLLAESLEQALGRLLDPRR